MTPKSLDKLIVALIATTVRTFNRDGAIYMHATVVGTDGLLRGTSLDENQGTLAFSQEVSELASHQDTLAIVSVAPATIRGITSSEGRRDVVCVTVERANETIVRIWPVVCDGDGNRLGDEMVALGYRCVPRLTPCLKSPARDAP